VSEPPVDLRVVLQSLHDHRVDYVLFGSAAMLFYGYVRNTEDIDIVVRGDQENLRRVHDWLVSLDAHLLLRPARRFGSRERWEMLQGSNASVLTRLGQVAIVQRLPGLPEWDRVVAESEHYELGDISPSRCSRARR
jgi:acylphosphatase